jgi:membrane-associated HD superfamily phosphohydrolase
VSKIELKKTRFFLISRFFLYIVLAVFCLTLQMLDIDFVKPLPLIPLAVCFAINESGEFKALAGGIFCGLLLDNSMNTFFGYSAVFLAVFAVFTSLLFFYVFRPNIGSIFIATMVYSFIYCLAHYFFYYRIWGYDPDGLMFKDYTIPCFCYTAVSTIVIYPLMGLINKLRIKSAIKIKDII